ncbi:hypothetical protein Tco_0950925 [Tanacetum coccineum]|uniref:Uncharacterized protein n=1 Tax=Tanacetum coccineum TaxID=301880 RepID=A0ABQ5DSM4_9ASTR
MFKNNVPTTKRVLVKNLQNFSSFLYAHLSEDNWVKHEESIASYADLRVAVEGFTIEADNNRNNYDIVINNVMESVEKINGARIKERTTLLKALNRVSKTLEADSALKASKQKMEDTNTNTSSNITNLTVLLRERESRLGFVTAVMWYEGEGGWGVQDLVGTDSLKEDPEFNQRLLKAAEGYI